MPDTSRAQCPACGANIADDGRSRVIECAYCRTKVTVEREPPEPEPPLVWKREVRREPVRVELTPAFDAEDVRAKPARASGCGVAFGIACGISAIGYLVYSAVITNLYTDMDPWDVVGPGTAMLVLFVAVPILTLVIRFLLRLRH